MDSSTPRLDYATQPRRIWPSWLSRGRVALVLMLAVVLGYFALRPRSRAMFSTNGISTRAGKVLVNGNPVAGDTEVFDFNDYDSVVGRSDIDRIFRDTEWLLTRKLGPPTTKQIRYCVGYPILVDEWIIGGQHLKLSAYQGNDRQGVRLHLWTTPGYYDADPSPRSPQPGESVLTVLEREGNFAGYCSPALAGGLICAIGMMWYLLGFRAR